MANLTGEVVIPQQWGTGSTGTGGGTGTPLEGTPTSSRTGTTALAAQTSDDLDSTQVSGTARLVGILLGGDVRFQATLHTVVDGVASATLLDFYHPFGGTKLYTFPDTRFFQVTEVAGGGFDGFRLTVTNCEGISSGDILATFMWEEV